MTIVRRISGRMVLEQSARPSSGDADPGNPEHSGMEGEARSSPMLAWSKLRAPDVVVRAQAGDENALERLIRVYDAAVYRVCYRIIGSIGGAEDARQETFIRMIQSIEKCQSPVRFSGWLLSIATHVSLDIARQKKESGSSLAAKLTPNTGADDPLAACIKKEELNQLSGALMALTPRMRMLLSLQFEEGLTPLQIGAILDIPSNQIRVELFRARQALKRRIASFEFRTSNERGRNVE